MVRFEKTLVDKFVNGTFRGKREIGRPLKYNIRTKDMTGWIELVFNPRTPVEQYVSQAIRFANPYIFAITYKFHAEKAREAGKYQISDHKSQNLTNADQSHQNKRHWSTLCSRSCTGVILHASGLCSSVASVKLDSNLIYYYRHACRGFV